MQGQLLDQRLAQISIVIHDQDLAGIGHCDNPLNGCGGALFAALKQWARNRDRLRR
jgi:hypothetical protein